MGGGWRGGGSARLHRGVAEEVLQPMGVRSGTRLVSEPAPSTTELAKGFGLPDEGRGKGVVALSRLPTEHCMCCDVLLAAIIRQCTPHPHTPPTSILRSPNHLSNYLPLNFLPIHYFILHHLKIVALGSSVP